MTFEVKKVDYVNGDNGPKPTCLEVQTEIGKVKVEDSIFKGLIKEKGKTVGVELTNGIKVRDLNKQYTPDGKVTIFEMPIANSESGKNISLYVEDSTVHVASENREHNSIDIYNRKGRVSITKDPEDSVSYRTDNEDFIVQQTHFYQNKLLGK